MVAMIRKGNMIRKVEMSMMLLGMASVTAGAATLEVGRGFEYRTIQAAADVARAGDEVVIHAGTYREWVKPINAGTEKSPITYRAASGEKVVVTGADQVRNWTKKPDGTWSAKVAYDSFGGMNPFSDFISGNWFWPKKGKRYFRTRLLQGGKVLELHGDEVFSEMRAVSGTDRAKSAEGHLSLEVGHAILLPGMATGTIIARFESDPNEVVPEFVVRPACFYPVAEHRDYIRVLGIAFENAGPNWAPPTSEQVGVIGTNWSRGWVVEDCSVSGSSAAGITLGKYGDEFDNFSADSQRYTSTVERAASNGLDRVGHHLIRRCRVRDCGQAGICGSLGAMFSMVEGCEISHCHWHKDFDGAEMAGIKIHGAVDFTISSCRIHHCGNFGGIWLDWMAQGARIVGNVLWANDEGQDLYSEVNHGPVLVEGNDFLSKRAFRSCSQSVAFVANRIRGGYNLYNDKRRTPIFGPHSAKLMSLDEFESGDGAHVFINNILAVLPDTSVCKHPCRMEDNWIVPPSGWTIDEQAGTCRLDVAGKDMRSYFKAVDGTRLGTSLFIRQPFPEPSVSIPRMD